MFQQSAYNQEYPRSDYSVLLESNYALAQAQAQITQSQAQYSQGQLNQIANFNRLKGHHSYDVNNVPHQTSYKESESYSVHPNMLQTQPSNLTRAKEDKDVHLRSDESGSVPMACNWVNSSRVADWNQGLNMQHLANFNVNDDVIEGPQENSQRHCWSQ